MQVAVSHYDWRVLRTVVRAKGRPVAGSKLRLDMARRSKDGTFLDDLVRAGLLAVAAAGNTPFEATYTLTERGKEAAEFGVFDMEFAEIKKLDKKKRG